jgi:hypothetical protein
MAIHPELLNTVNCTRETGGSREIKRGGCYLSGLLVFIQFHSGATMVITTEETKQDRARRKIGKLGRFEHVQRTTDCQLEVRTFPSRNMVTVICFLYATSITRVLV